MGGDDGASFLPSAFACSLRADTLKETTGFRSIRNGKHNPNKWTEKQTNKQTRNNIETEEV